MKLTKRGCWTAGPLPALLLLAALSHTGIAQTAIDLRTQSRTVDFTAAPVTRPVKTGTSLPGSCLVGEMFFKSDAPGGANLYGCAAANVWSLQSGGVEPSVPNYEQWFTGQTSVTLTHGMSTTSVILLCYDNDGRQVDYDRLTIDDAVTVTVDFASPQSGRCVVNGVGGVIGGGGGGGTVSSVFGRAGAVVKAEGDYNLADLGDVSGRQGSSATVQMFTGSAPTSGHCAVFDSSGNVTSQTCPSGGGGAVSSVFGRAGAVVKAEGDYNLADLGDVTGIRGNATTVQMFSGASTTTGHCAIFDSNGNVTSQSCPSGGGGAVSSVFGRAGAVVKAEGDYNLADLGDVTGKRGSTTTVQMFSGASTTTGHCAIFDSSGNVTSQSCPSGSGGGDSVAGGTGISITGTAPKVISVDTATVPAYLAGSSSISDWGTGDSVPAQGCTEKTFTLSGASQSDGLAPRIPPTLPANLAVTMFVSSPNTVLIRLCNPTTGSISVSDGLTFGATIVRSF